MRRLYLLRKVILFFPIFLIALTVNASQIITPEEFEGVGEQLISSLGTKIPDGWEILNKTYYAVQYSPDKTIVDIFNEAEIEFRLKPGVLPFSRIIINPPTQYFLPRCRFFVQFSGIEWLPAPNHCVTKRDFGISLMLEKKKTTPASFVFIGNPS